MGAEEEDKKEICIQVNMMINLGGKHVISGEAG